MSWSDQFPIEIDDASVKLSYINGEIEAVIDTSEFTRELVMIDDPDMLLEQLIDEGVIELE
jgi:hypothetical protein